MRRIVLVAAVGLALLAVACSGGSSKPTTPGASATPTGTTPATERPASQTPTATTPQTVADLHPVPLTEGPPVPLPARFVLYFYGGKVPIEGTPQVLLRAYQGPSGLVVDDISAGVPKGENSLFNWVIDPEHGRLAVRVCLTGRCQFLDGPDLNSRSVAYGSDDGGLSWKEFGPIAPDAVLIGFTSVGRLVAFDGSTGSAHYFYIDGGADIPAPANSSLTTDGTVVWRRGDGAILDLAGNVVQQAARLPADPNGEEFRTIWLTHGAVSWTPFPRDEAVSGYISDVALDGSLGRTVEWSGYDMNVVGRFDADRLLVIRYYPVPGAIGQAFILDLRDGSLRKISGLRSEEDGDTYPVTLVPGPFARVANAGDCLNVREKASKASLSLGCFKDGVLLRLRGQDTQTAESITWVAVETPDGRAGWASAEFLER